MVIGHRPGVSATDARVRIGPLMPIPGVVTDLGGNAEQLCRRAGLTLPTFADPDQKIPFLAASRLIEMCAQETRCEKFGFLVGQRVVPSALGLAGFMLRASPDVRTALELLIKHLSLHDEGGAASLTSSGETAELAYTLIHPNNPAADQIYDLSIAVACNIMRALCGPRWSPIVVRLTRRRCPDWPAYRMFFASPLELGAPFPSLVFPATCLEQAVPTADPYLLRHLEQQAQTLPSPVGPDTPDKLRRSLYEAFAQRTYSETECARRLGLQVRTLHRRLEAGGTSFRKELVKFRHEKACEMLASTRITAAAIAEELGFADTTAFSRAFKQWTGMTTTQWRHANAG